MNSLAKPSTVSIRSYHEHWRTQNRTRCIVNFKQHSTFHNVSIKVCFGRTRLTAGHFACAHQNDNLWFTWFTVLCSHLLLGNHSIGEYLMFVNVEFRGSGWMLRSRSRNSFVSFCPFRHKSPLWPCRSTTNQWLCSKTYPIPRSLILVEQLRNSMRRLMKRISTWVLELNRFMFVQNQYRTSFRVFVPISISAPSNVG